MASLATWTPEPTTDPSLWTDRNTAYVPSGTIVNDPVIMFNSSVINLDGSTLNPNPDPSITIQPVVWDRSSEDTGNLILWENDNG